MEKEEEKKEKTKFGSMLRFLCGVKAWQNVCPLVKHKAAKYQLHWLTTPLAFEHLRIVEVNRCNFAYPFIRVIILGFQFTMPDIVMLPVQLSPRRLQLAAIRYQSYLEISNYIRGIRANRNSQCVRGFHGGSWLYQRSSSCFPHRSYLDVYKQSSTKTKHPAL